MTISAFPINDVSILNASIDFSSIWADAETQTIEETIRNHFRVNLMDFIPEAQRSDIRNHVTPGSGVDHADYMDAAIAALGSKGGVIEIPAGFYRFSRTFHLKTRIWFIGEGGNGNLSQYYTTRLRWPKDLDAAMVVHSSDTYEGGRDGPDTGSAAGTQFDNLVIDCETGASTGYGIWGRAPLTMRNCTVRDFGSHCIFIKASASIGDDFEHGNANLWTLFNVTARESATGYGVYIDGHDVNGGVGIRVSATGNVGGGIFDGSFLGCTWIGCHTETNTGPAYSTDDVNCRSVFLGCYTENGQGASSYEIRTLIIGGLTASASLPPTSGGGHVTAFTHSPTAFAQTDTDGKDIELRLGTATRSMMDYVAEGDNSTGLRFLRWDDLAGAVQVRHGTSGSNIIWQYTTDLAADAGSTQAAKDEDATKLTSGSVVARNGKVYFPSLTDSSEYRKLYHQFGGKAADGENMVGDETLTAAEFVGGACTRDCGGSNRTITLPTAANLVAGVESGAFVGMVIWCKIVNGSDAAETITIAEGSGGSWPTGYTAAARVIPQNTEKFLRVRFTNVTGGTEAYEVC